MRGRIIKGIGGLYYVYCEKDAGAKESKNRYGAVYECRAKGIFRKDNIRPLVGDEAEVDVLDEEKKKGNVRELLPRRNELIRPAVANVDQALVVFSSVKPRPNFNLCDRFLILMAQQGVETIVCFNKTDIDEEGSNREYQRIYQACGFPALGVSAKTGEGIDSLKELLEGKVTVTAGPSGVGKSSLINCLQPNVVMQTGEISARIERGRHTTRHTELIALGKESYILDTPGFTSLGLFSLEKEGLSAFYPEFREYEKSCRFADCSHIGEPYCGVKDAVAEGKVSRMRYENYCLLYRELEYIPSKGSRNAGRL